MGEDFEVEEGLEAEEVLEDLMVKEDLGRSLYCPAFGGSYHNYVFHTATWPSLRPLSQSRLSPMSPFNLRQLDRQNRQTREKHQAARGAGEGKDGSFSTGIRLQRS